MVEMATKMKYLTVLLLLSGCASSELKPQPRMYFCQVLPYALTLEVLRYNVKDALEDANVVAKRLNLKDVDVVCRPEE